MPRPKICVTIVADDPPSVRRVAPLADLFEVRIDLIGRGWRDVVKHLKKPWIACNRPIQDGGRWWDSESGRLNELSAAVGLGAKYVDIEMGTPGVASLVKEFKTAAVCLVSHHDFEKTPLLKQLRTIVEKQRSLGADVSKVVTTAWTFGDNRLVLQLVKEYSGINVISFAMGAAGQISRILCPLVGGLFTYASLQTGRESASGQLTVRELRSIYGLLGYDEK